MSGLEARHTIAHILGDGLPAGWKFVRTVREVELPDVPLVLIKATVIEPHPAVAVASALLVTVTVTVVSPLADIDAAEDELDADLLPRVLDVITASPLLGFERAEKVVWQGSRLAYDLSVTVTETI